MDKKPMAAIQRCGYIQCQIDISEFLWSREKALFSQVTKLESQISEEKGLLEKQKKIIELNKLFGELEALKLVLAHISSLKPDSH